MINQIDQKEAKQLKKYIENNFSQEQVAFSQAVSVCSAIVEMGLLRASEEDIVERLCARFDGFLDKQHVRETVSFVVYYGLQNQLFEEVDEEYISLTEIGQTLGKEWLHKIVDASNC